MDDMDADIQRQYGRKGFVPPPRFRFFNGLVPSSGEEVRSNSLHSPRPLDWLEQLRFRSSVKRFTARDHLILEILASAVYEALLPDSILPIIAGKMRLGPGQYAVKLATLLGILNSSGLGSHASKRDAVDSLLRLQAATFTLPNAAVPRLRRSRKQRIHEKQVQAGKRSDEPRPVGVPHAPPKTYDDVMIDRRIDADRAAEKGWKRIAAPNGVVEDRRIRRPRLVTFPVLGPFLDSMDLADVPEISTESLEGTTAFRPLHRFVVEEGADGGDWLAFEPAMEIVRMMRRERLVGWRRVPYSYLDLSALASFSSPYTAPFYRQVLASSYDRQRRRPRYDEVRRWDPAPDEIARIVSYTRQSGGWRGQVNRNVVQRILADLARLGPGHIEVSEVDSPKDRFSFEIVLPIADIAQLATTAVRLDDPGQDRYGMPKFLPAEVAPYAASASALSKAVKLLRLEGEDIVRLAKAWRLAVDELHMAGDPYYSDLTGVGSGRRRRGAALLQRILAAGADMALIEFALEEDRVPDLTLPETIDRLEYEGTLDFAEEDRMARVAAGANSHMASPITRIRRLTGVEEHVAREQAGRIALRIQDEETRRSARVEHSARIQAHYTRSERDVDLVLARQASARLTSEQRQHREAEETARQSEYDEIMRRIEADTPPKPLEVSEMSEEDRMFHEAFFSDDDNSNASE